MQKTNPKQPKQPAQTQSRPGQEYKMVPFPVFDTDHKGSGKLQGKIALITGGDSGIGRAVATLFAKEGADIVIVYLSEKKDAHDTQKYIEAYGRKCLLIEKDISIESNCKKIITQTIKEFGQIDILVNNAGVHYEQKNLEDITTKQLVKTFSTNFFSMFWLTRDAIAYMKRGSCIINSSSVTAYRGSGGLIDYASTKGAIVSFTRSLSANLAPKGIRVNGVAPGPIWTPLVVSSFTPKHVAEFGSDVPMKRAGQPAEIAPSYLFLACDDSSYMTGQFLHPNGGEIVNS